jgi:hypothetical protein
VPENPAASMLSQNREAILLADTGGAIHGAGEEFGGRGSRVMEGGAPALVGAENAAVICRRRGARQKTGPREPATPKG